jgi:hypothetical protein
MGAIAEGFVAYAQPLLDQTDGSEEQLNKALAIGQLCFNLALMSEAEQEKVLSDTKSSLQMDDTEFEAFRSSIIASMIQRHHEMFPLMHGWGSPAPSQSAPSPQAHSRKERYPGTGPYAPCPCKSGKKYKFCCRAKRG